MHRALRIACPAPASIKSAEKNGTAVHSLLLHHVLLRAQVVDRLLVGGCDTDVQNNTGNTALHLAAAKGSMEMVQRLLAQDADVNIRNAKGMNAAASAAAAGYFDVVTRLVQVGSVYSCTHTHHD